jgi:hypothetical protein
MNKTAIKIGELVYTELLDSEPKTEEEAIEIINKIIRYINMQLNDYLIDEGINCK